MQGDLMVEGTATSKDGLTIESLDPQLYALKVDGPMMTTDGVYRPSDIRLKTDIEDLVGPLETLLRLRGVSFAWRDAVCDADGRHLGMIAQEVEAVLPQWVHNGPDGYKAVSYEGFEALAVEAMRELAMENDRLQEQNDDLRARMDRLERLVGGMSGNGKGRKRMKDEG